jgi:anaerobic magnesium-protoporphyrin IX monomethyl ester cyclase
LEQVGRTADLGKISDAIRRLKRETLVEVHLDLVAGLPGEDYGGFLDSLQALADLAPDMIQIEPLKVLKGAPMRAIAEREGYEFSAAPPYTILRNPWLTYLDICRIETIGRLLDLFGKHGGFPTAFTILKHQHTFSGILDRMACRVGTENLSSLSCRRVFELFARLAGADLDAASRVLLYDALLFDYCHCEMPLMGKLPDFAANHQGSCSWPTLRELPDTVGAPTGSRVKSFRSTFIQDYRTVQESTEPTTLTFTYISAAGRGLQIVISSAAS